MWGSPQPCSPHSCSLRNSTNTVGSGRVPSHGRGWLDQLSCHLVPDPALQVSQPSTYSIYELLEELVLHNQIQEHDISTDDKNLNNGCDQRPWQQLSSIYGAPETRDLEPDQWLVAHRTMWEKKKYWVRCCNFQCHCHGWFCDGVGRM